MWWILLSPALAQSSIEGGTQPETLAHPLATVGSCTMCHSGWDDAPHDAFRGTMMAMAMHDPMFQAALTIAEQDIPDIGEFCLRCHTPPGWLEGRCLPGDGSALVASDYEGITCDTCHRMTQADGGPLIGNARYTIVDTLERRSGTVSGYATHSSAVDPYVASSELCGTCHEVLNPLFQDFPVERTYSEWKASAYNGPPGGADTKQCQDCHMEAVTGSASNTPGLPSRTVHSHRMVGANSLVPKVLARERPDLGITEALLATADAAAEHLRTAATVEIPPPPEPAPGEVFSFDVVVTNECGHKLPTGYPEGRRLWLEVVVTDATGAELLRSGAIDPATMVLDASDPQLRKYEARLGSDGEYNYHMVKQNEILFDSRIPPRGFRPTPDLLPVGQDYPVLPDGSLAHWDTATYTLTVPATAVAPLTVSATLWHQTTTPEFAAFLRDENVTNETGDEWWRMYVEAGMDPPGFVADASATVALGAPAPPVADDTADDDPRGSGCGCASAAPGPAAALLLASVALARRRRR